MPGTVKSELLSDAGRSYKCDSQEKVRLIQKHPLTKGHFITAQQVERVKEKVSSACTCSTYLPEFAVHIFLIYKRR